jgi:glucosamine--fructose-6-phosphate aminotransferase (isomerizing)
MGGPGERARHPFHMYDAIRAQPDATAEVVERNAAPIDRLGAVLGGFQRVFLVGVGTSYHAAQIGAYFLQEYGGELDARAIDAFEFAVYGPRLTKRDFVLVVSHRGSKLYPSAALLRAREAGCATALITGRDSAAPPDVADHILATVAQEKSSAHTVSYAGALAALAALADRAGRARRSLSLLPTDFLTRTLPAALRTALANEAEVAGLAAAHAGRRRIWLTGGGPGAVTAAEIALKIRETSFLQAEGMAVETLLHGPFRAAEAEDLFVLIAPSGAAQARLVEVGRMVRAIGAAYLVVGDGTASGLREGADGWITVPSVPEPFAPLTCLVPLQLFAYHLALARGTNPDNFREDDARFARASELVRL